VETIAAVVPIVNFSGETYAKIGVGKSTGNKLNFCIWTYQ
jgi:NADH-quinone oxidoreductase subunit F